MSTERKCSVDGCSRPHRARGYCKSHYERWRRGCTENEIETPIGELEDTRDHSLPDECSLEGCARDYYARHLCERHYAQKRKYGVSEEWLEEHIGSDCEVCGVSEERSPRPMMVDHNHETGEVRGILCWACNVALGALGDEPDRILALAEYVE